VVVVVDRVFAGLVDHHGDMGTANLVANGGGQVQLASDAEAESQAVEYGAGGPGFVGHPRNGGKAQASHVADHLEHCGNGTDSANGGNVDGFLLHDVFSVCCAMA